MKKLILLLTAVLWVSHLEAQTSKVNVTIDGPGVVDEYLTLGANGTKQLKLKAVPCKFLGTENVTFDGWSGDATGTSTEITVDANIAQNIHATFTYHRPVKTYPLLNLKQSWVDMGKPMYIEMPTLTETEASYYWRGHEYLPVDYNRDGYLDYVEFPMKGPNGIDNHREKVRFWLGQADGTFVEDPKNDKLLDGTVYSIHIKYADFNNDGWPDFCTFSSGYDRNPSDYDYPVILMSNSTTGVYTRLSFETVKRYFHGGEVGDIDNDGDLDVVFLDTTFETEYDESVLLINDGSGNFTQMTFKSVFDLDAFQSRYGVTDGRPGHGDLNITDLNGDGKNDLIFTGSDIFDPYFSGPVVFWGSKTISNIVTSEDKILFGGTNYSLLPPSREGYGINEDFVFYDLNGDGKREIIAERNGDGVRNGSVFYNKGYLQVCEWNGSEFVDKTAEYIPVENTAYNNTKSETCLWIENIDGTDYVCAAWGGLGQHLSGVGVDQRPIYAIRNGKLEPVEGYSITKTPSFDEGLPIYVDDTRLTDIRFYNDGVNAADLLTEWAPSTWDPVEGNMWRINFAHHEDTHSGRTCIRWNRDNQNPTTEHQSQSLSFMFVSNVDITKLRKEDYFVELYIKNSDADLTLNINGVEIGANDTDEGHFTGQWQRMSFPLDKMYEGVFSGFWIEAKGGDLNNVFYLDDIRIRRLADSGIDDYDRTFLKNYLNETYKNKERTAQVRSQEFKAMLKGLIDNFAPTSLDDFNSYISDYDVLLTRGMATCMVYYTARFIGAETANTTTGTQPTDMWTIESTNYNELLPHWNDNQETNTSSDVKYWRYEPFNNSQGAWQWNFCHVSDHSRINVIALDKTANSFHMNDPLTWEDAIRAITRLYDSLDPATVATVVNSSFYTVSFDAAGGSPAPLSQSILEGSKASAPTGLSRSGYELGGWMNGTVLYDFSTAVTGNLALVAHWKKLLSNGITVSELANQTYSGSAYTPAVTVKDGETDITNQCSFTYANNVNAGTATVTISAKSESTDYSGQISKTFSILPKTVSSPTIILGERIVTYTGSEQKPAVSQVKDGEVVIPAETYSVSYSNNINAGTATVTVTSKDGGNYSFNGTASFTIAKAAGVISYETTTTVSKPLGAADFSIALKNTGDGVVSYSSSDEKVATIDASSGVVKILAGGETEITATVADGKNYTYGTKTAKYELKVQDQITDKNEPVTVNGSTFYEPVKEFSDAIKEQINTDIALDAAANSRTKVTADGGLTFSQGSNIGMALLAQTAGDVLRFVFEGKMFGDSQKLRQKGAATRGTRSSGDMELVSGVEYEVIEAGNIVITMNLAEAPVTLKNISVTKSSATAIDSIEAEESTNAVWHDLNGHVINGTPVKRGVYIKNGKKIVVK